MALSMSEVIVIAWEQDYLFKTNYLDRCTNYLVLCFRPSKAKINLFLPFKTKNNNIRAEIL